MRSLIVMTTVATALVACGQKNSNTSGSQLMAASAPAGSLVYSVSYLNAVDTGTLQLGANNRAQIHVKGLPVGQTGLMLVTIGTANAVQYVGDINDLQIASGSTTYRLNMSTAPTGTQYCGNNFDNFDNFNRFDNFGNGFSNFINSFTNGSNNNKPTGLNNGSTVTTNTGTTTTTGTNTATTGQTTTNQTTTGTQLPRSIVAGNGGIVLDIALPH